MNSFRHNIAIVTGVSIIFATGIARSEDATSLQTEGGRGPHSAVVGKESQVSARVRHDFVTFAGSDANADSIVTGLRRGSPITLSSSGAAQQSPSVTFTPPTRPMGNGNIDISLALAEHRLTSIGITQPTPEQLKSALVGGTVTIGTGATAPTLTLTGVLTQRSQGMGWGNIARSQGVTLESVMSGIKITNHVSAYRMQPIVAANLARPGSVNAYGATHGSGIVTAAGSKVISPGSPSNNTTGASMSAVRGGGGLSGAAGANGRANGNAHVR